MVKCCVLHILVILSLHILDKFVIIIKVELAWPSGADLGHFTCVKIAEQFVKIADSAILLRAAISVINQSLQFVCFGQYVRLLTFIIASGHTAAVLLNFAP